MKPLMLANYLPRMVRITALLLALSAAPVEAQDASRDAEGAISFPRTLSSDAGTVVVHAPEVDSWKGFASLQARVAIEVAPAGEEQTVFGTATFSASTDTNLELRVVAVEDIEVVSTSFPGTDEARQSELDGIVRGAIQSRQHFLPLDVMLSYIAPDASLPETPGLSFEAPPIFYSNVPAVLVITDGEPLLAPIPDTQLQYAVNTNWDLLRYRDKEWYLRHGSRWLTSKDLGGAWRYDGSLPRDFSRLPDDGNWDAARDAVPPMKGKAAAPTVFVSDRPAELIVTDGQPQHRTIGAPGLEYIEDTESDVFRYDKRYYYLVSGRWFSAAALRGPWEHVEELPDVFASVPADHEKGHVLAAVPNTDEARLAALEASLPRKATVSRLVGKDLLVFYQGEPQFEAIPGTGVERAVNSPNDVFRVGLSYYVCDNAVWYLSDHAAGPWVLADEVPEEIYRIPPASPSYHVTYVRIDDSDADSVSTSYTSGYFGVYVGFGVAMYGSGWYYPPYYGYYPGFGYPYYPYYYPYPYSYGGSAWYNPATGMYGRSASVYGPFGGYGRAAAYNPQTGAYARGSAVWDSNEIAGRGVAYNPRTGTGVATHRYNSEYGGWGESLVTHGDRWVQTRSEWSDGSSTTEFRTSAGGSGTIERQRAGDAVLGAGEFQRGEQSLSTVSARGDRGTLIAGQTGSGESAALGRSAGGDLYAGKDGNVYRRGEDGWQQYTGDGWSPVAVPDEYAARFEGTGERLDAPLDAARSGNFGAEGRAVDRDGPRRQAAESFDGGGRFDNRAVAGDGRPGLDGPGYGFDTSRRRELDRSFDARRDGYARYNNRQFNRGSQLGGGRQIPRRRR